MKIKKFKNSDNAVVGIVAAFLIVGLIVAVLSVIQTQYVPKWMREKEADHMNELADQFAQLNYAINTHVVNQRSNVPISTTITLGSKEMPYLMSTRAYGELQILTDQFKFNAVNNTISYTKNSSIIKYSSYNNYFINQNYIFETGGVILDQDSGNSMYIRPRFDISYNKVWNITIKFNMINIATIGGKDQSVHGYGPAPIQTEYKTGDDDPVVSIDNIKYLNITSNYKNSWHSFINRSLMKAGLNSRYSVKNYTISIDDINDKIIVEFNDNIIVNIELYYYEIGAQIAPGWIEER
jgi:hypothetical protein